MKVLFLEHVLHVAKSWEIKEVSSGYAANFLFPKKLAVPYTPEIENKLKQQVKKKESDRRMLLWNKQEMIEKLSGQIFEFSLKAFWNHALWSIQAKDVAEYIAHRYGFPVQKKHIDFGPHHSSLKDFGEHDIYISFGNNVAGKAKIRIIPQK